MASAAMNSGAGVMEFFRSPLSRTEEQRDGRWHPEVFQRTRLWLVGYRGPRCSTFIDFAGFGSPHFGAHAHVEVSWRLALSIENTVVQGVTRH
jgi:hypothetical protein